MAGSDAERTRFLDRVKQQCSNKEAQLNIHQSLFGASASIKKDSDSSFFLSDKEFVTAPLQYPEAEQVKEWDYGGYWLMILICRLYFVFEEMF